ncbi:MAG: hypothetical protein ABS75_07180 [Pelagibacterium sp. SCN 63-23]|nr:MAG: hypothetical protein ABS75_07180 [Pelagibacterium sp. SCN 63-23]
MDVQAEINHLHAEIMAVQSLLFGVCRALKDRNLAADVLTDAFEYADNVAISASNDPGNSALSQRGTQVLDILEQLRKAALD